MHACNPLRNEISLLFLGSELFLLPKSAVFRALLHACNPWPHKKHACFFWERFLPPKSTVFWEPLLPAILCLTKSCLLLLGSELFLLPKSAVFRALLHACNPLPHKNHACFFLGAVPPSEKHSFLGALVACNPLPNEIMPVVFGERFLPPKSTVFGSPSCLLTKTTSLMDALSLVSFHFHDFAQMFINSGSVSVQRAGAEGNAGREGDAEDGCQPVRSELVPKESSRSFGSGPWNPWPRASLNLGIILCSIYPGKHPDCYLLAQDSICSCQGTQLTIVTALA